jgi:hypothetical protein
MRTRNDKRLLANEGICLVTHPEVALTLGKSEAIFLQQLHYWLTADHEMGTVLDGKRWIYNSYKAWAENLRIYSESTIRRAVSKLEKMGILLTQNLNKKKSDHTKWYTINYDVLKDLIPISAVKKHKREGEAKTENSLFKMSSPSVQNGHIIYKENKNNFRDKSLSSGNFQRERDLKELNLNKSSSELSKNILQEMVLIWNQIVEEGQKTVELTSKRICFLKKAFETQFNSCLEKWKEFCRRIASSKFLMGEIKASFKASLDWVLKFEVMKRILEGDFGVGDRAVYLERNQGNTQEMERVIQDSSEPQDVKQFRLALLKRLGEAAYASWLKETQIDLKTERVSIQAKSQFATDYIARAFLSDIEKEIQILLPKAYVSVGVA